MHLGALIVTTGITELPGVASLLETTGSTCAGNRMITAFQCSGVQCVGLVLEQCSKKQQRRFVQEGVLFFHAEDTDTSTLDSARLGLALMADKFDRIFLVTGNQSLFLPQTLDNLLSQDGDIVIPTYAQMNGCPVLLSASAAKELLSCSSAASLEQAVASLTGHKVFVPVNDPGTVVKGTADKNRHELVQKQAQQLLRPATEVKIQIGNAFFDRKLSMLLHLIQETGSVRSASERMQISYSTAWGMLNDIDSSLDTPLILRKRGGTNGSGCELSEKCRSILDAYDRYCTAIDEHAHSLYNSMLRDILQ